LGQFGIYSKIHGGFREGIFVVKDTGDKFIASVIDTVRNNQKAYDNDTAEELFNGVNDTDNKFFIGVIDTGDKTVLAISGCLHMKKKNKV
jgi:hypothetical protein